MTMTETTQNNGSAPEKQPPRPQILTRFSVPKGNYETWNPQEVYEAELVCKLFANSYIQDFSQINTAIRLGATYKTAKSIGADIFNHWLTQHYIRQLIDSFDQQNVATASRVVSLLWRDASNFDPKANPMARVQAQKTLATALGMTAVQNNKKAEEAAKQVGKGGVLRIAAHPNPAAWEGASEASQESLEKSLQEEVQTAAEVDL